MCDRKLISPTVQTDSELTPDVMEDEEDDGHGRALGLDLRGKSRDEDGMWKRAAKADGKINQLLLNMRKKIKTNVI